MLHWCFSFVRMSIVCKSVLTGYDSVSCYSVYQFRCPFGFIELVIALMKLVWTYIYSGIDQGIMLFLFGFSSWPLFSEGFKNNTAEMSVSAFHKMVCLVFLSFFSWFFPLTHFISHAVYLLRHLTNVLHVFASRHRWALCLSFHIAVALMDAQLIRLISLLTLLTSNWRVHFLRTTFRTKKALRQSCWYRWWA